MKKHKILTTKGGAILNLFGGVYKFCKFDVILHFSVVKQFMRTLAVVFNKIKLNISIIILQITNNL